MSNEVPTKYNFIPKRNAYQDHTSTQVFTDKIKKILKTVIKPIHYLIHLESKKNYITN